MIIFLHGFLGSPTDWDPISSHFSGGCSCPHLLDIEELTEFGRSLPEKAHLVGYSMGGRLALWLNHLFPGKFASITCISSHPGLESGKEERWRSDQQLMEEMQTLTVPAFLKKWYSQSMFQGCPIPKTREGLDLHAWSHQLKKFSIAKQPNFWDDLPKENIPILFLFGERDEKYSKMATRINSMGRHVRAKIVPDSSHCVHLEKPSQCIKEIGGMVLTEIVQTQWIQAGVYEDILYEKCPGIAKITMNRPHVHNAFRPKTVTEMREALQNARMDESIGVIILTGAGSKAFCSGGDQKIRGQSGYSDENGRDVLNVLDFQREIRTCPKPVIAMVRGYAIGGGHVLHVVCDLTIASDTAIFGQTGPKVGSFDGGYGAGYLARIVGQKKAREIWYLCKQYSAQEAYDMGLVNIVVEDAELEETTMSWCNKILEHSPLAIRCLKSALNADVDGQTGLQELAGNATLLYYMSEEAQEGHKAYKEKRKPNFAKFPKRG